LEIPTRCLFRKKTDLVSQLLAAKNNPTSESNAPQKIVDSLKLAEFSEIKADTPGIFSNLSRETAI
jgi:hypothetical protein